jgi:hypothetical protein
MFSNCIFAGVVLNSIAFSLISSIEISGNG